MRRRKPLEETGPPVPVPARLRWPHVEDWVTLDDLDVRPVEHEPGFMSPEALTVWRLEQLATEEWRAAIQSWLREHQGRVDMPIRERRAWQLVLCLGGQRARWRDQPAFLATVRS